MEYYLGSLNVRLQGIPYVAPSCDETTCKRIRHPSLRVSYRFPPWFFQRAIHTLISNGHVSGPQLNLACTRVVARDSKIFSLARRGDIAGVQDLFEKGLASPFDASAVGGHTALHLAILRLHFELCKFLLTQGARPDIQASNGLSSADYAYHDFYALNWDEPTRERVQALVNKDSWVEEQQFTVLHRVILGLEGSNLSLADKLSITTKDINVPDSTGRTPISWAAHLGNEDAVSNLLAHGANPNKDSCDGTSALHFACLGGHSQILSWLLDKGASPTKRDLSKRTALMLAAWHHDQPQLVEQLLAQPGVQLNDIDENDWNALWYAADASNDKVLSHLLDLGTDPNQTDMNGWNALLWSIYKDAHPSVRILLKKSRQSGLDLTHCDHDGDGCLHYLALFADQETASIFLQAVQNGEVDLLALDTTLVNNGRFTPRDTLARCESHEVRTILGEAFAIIDDAWGDGGSVYSEDRDDVAEDESNVDPGDGDDAAEDEGSVGSEDVAYTDAPELPPQCETLDEGLRDMSRC